MPLPVDQLPTFLDQVARLTVEAWENSSRESAPDDLRTAMTGLSDAQRDTGVDGLTRAVEAVVTTFPSSLMEEDWCDPELRKRIAALRSVLRQLRYSDEAKAVLRLCDELSRAAGALRLDEAAATRLVAALMLLEDATCAVEGYRARVLFDHVDEAYLAKFGLLQALQLGFDAAQRVCRELGVSSRADATQEGKSIKVTRHIVAGHPLGGTMYGQNWHHFHDRSSAQDRDVIRIMSFLDDGTWSGQSQSTAEVIKNGLEVLRGLLQQARDQLPGSIPDDAPGLMFPAHDPAKRYVPGRG